MDLMSGQELAFLVHVERAVEVRLIDQLIGPRRRSSPLDQHLLGFLGERPARDDEDQTGEDEGHPRVKRRFSAHGHTSWSMEFHRAILYGPFLAAVNI
jgi:hypothetical protein